jgi:hypothetical protein
MTTPSDDATTRTALTELPEQQRRRALERYRTLRPHLELDVPLARVAKEASLPAANSSGLGEPVPTIWVGWPDPGWTGRSRETPPSGG